jgi:hypothetical protein
MASVAILMAVTACGSSGSSTESSTSDELTSTTIAVDYAKQYQDLVAPMNAQLDKLNSIKDRTQQIAEIKNAAVIERTFGNALLTSQWPAAATSAIQSLSEAVLALASLCDAVEQVPAASFSSQYMNLALQVTSKAAVVRALLGIDAPPEASTTTTVTTAPAAPAIQSNSNPRTRTAATSGSVTDRLGYTWEYQVFLGDKQTAGTPGGCPSENPRPGRANFPFSVVWRNRSNRIGEVPGLLITPNLLNDLSTVLPVGDDWPMPSGYARLASVQINDGDGTYCGDGNSGAPHGGMTVQPGGVAQMSGGLVNVPENLPPGVKLVFKYGMRDAPNFTVPLS